MCELAQDEHFSGLRLPCANLEAAEVPQLPVIMGPLGTMRPARGQLGGPGLWPRHRDTDSAAAEIPRR